MCMKEVVPIPAPHHYAVQSGMSYLMYIYTIKMVVFLKIYSSWGQNFNCRSPAVLHRIQKHIWAGKAHVIEPCLPPEVQDLCILTLADMAFEFVDDRHGPRWQMQDASAKQALKTCLSSFVSSCMQYCTASRLFHTIEIPGATNLGDALEFREQLRLLNANIRKTCFSFCILFLPFSSFGQFQRKKKVRKRTPLDPLGQRHHKASLSALSHFCYPLSSFFPLQMSSFALRYTYFAWETLVYSTYSLI